MTSTSILQRVAFHFGVEDAQPEFCGDTRIARDLDPAFRFAASLSPQETARNLLEISLDSSLAKPAERAASMVCRTQPLKAVLQRVAPSLSAVRLGALSLSSAKVPIGAK
ncbi:hypothetical protein [Mesorhizobium sp.]|uniref:hypothetical protein n=1 Tax=Mesorhizobium sp. TaxID=1871066 RepID=UPI000FE77748|nr:hypothetical protein [Mesorhizobium sp.]RWP31946.1 MAG: hypothetical protein EOR03_21700 [Mesorhizobium sp.]